MGVEIERKFLLRDDGWRQLVQSSTLLRQGYLSRGDQSSVRVRVQGDSAEIGVKSSRDGIHRLEFEYPIPLEDARQLLDRVAYRPLIEKTRHLVAWGEHIWEIDEFHGDNAPLILAEIELESADEAFQRPPWLGREVSTDRRYFNSNLSQHPYREWQLDAPTA